MRKSPSSVLLFEEANKRGLNPTWLTDYGFFIFSFQGHEIFVYQTKSFANGSIGSWLTSDKYATHVLLDAHSFKTPPYCYTKNHSELNAFFEKNYPIIAKPVLGEGAKEVRLIKTQGDIFQFDLASTIFEKYIEGIEHRYLLINGEIVAAQEKTPNPTESYPWRKSVRNLTPNDYERNKLSIALQINKLIPQKLLAVDFIQDEQGNDWVLEINSMPGIWPFENPHQGAPIHITSQILDLIIENQIKNRPNI